MISVQKALDLILGPIRTVGTERKDLLHSLGRVLAEPIVSSRDQPPWDNSAMDGYAVRHADITQASDQAPVRLEIIEEIPAGSLPKKMVGAGQASRIMTGAPMPDGADAVIRIEDTRPDGNRVDILRPADPGEDIRCRGEDIAAGQIVLERGCFIGPAEIGMLASMGRSVVQVFQQPRVAVLATGDELADLGEELTPDKIMNSNGYAMAAQVLEAGGVPINLGVARDTRESLRERLSEALAADLIVISGGVSVGEYDFVREVLAELGADLSFWKVAMKPGKPLAFGMIRNKPVFGLPGNPVSTMVTFEEFVRPALRKMQGLHRIFRPVIEAVLAEGITKPVGKIHFIRAVVTWTGGRYEVRATGSQSSGVLTSMLKANGLLVAPSDVSRIDGGQIVKVQLLGKTPWEQAFPGEEQSFI